MYDVTRLTESDGNSMVKEQMTSTCTPTNHKVSDESVQMRRGMSKALINRTVVNRARKLVLSDVCVSLEVEDQPLHIAETPVFTFVLPDINIYPDGFKAFLYKELIDSPTLVSLEQGGFLNWWADIDIGPRLYPLQTSGDGNCLLHAASLAMWGFHDRRLILRKLLALNMASGSATDAFRRRWRWQQTASNRQCGLVFSEEEWDKEWQYIVSLANWQPKNQSSTTAAVSTNRSHAGKQMDSETVFESLEELHVFILAHVLRRPIIVIAKSMLTNIDGEALAPIPFGGVYLPLQCAPCDCHRSPLLLTYDAAHFCALVWMDSQSTHLSVPLINPQLELLPLHFANDPGVDYDWRLADESSDLELSLDEKIRLIEQYMDVQISTMPTTDSLRRMEAFDRLMHQRRASLDSAQIDLMMNGGRSDDTRKPGSAGISRQIHGAVVRTFGSLGQSVSQKLKSVSHKTNKLVGTATQSSRRSTLAVRMISNHKQIPCAVLSQRRMFHQDDLVRNYLTQASQRYANLRTQSHLQSDELERVVSPKMRSGETHVSKTNTLPAFERKNTLLLAGKSKFYTMSYEDHCQSVDQSCGSSDIDQSSYSRPYSDSNHNSIFWPFKTRCQGLDKCPNPVVPRTGNLCATCFQAKRYSLVVQYPTAATKL